MLRCSCISCIYTLVVTLLLCLALVPPTNVFLSHYVLNNVLPSSRHYISSTFVHGPAQHRMLVALLKAGFFDHVYEKQQQATADASSPFAFFSSFTMDAASQPVTVAKVAADLKMNERFLFSCVQNLVSMHLVEPVSSGKGHFLMGRFRGSDAAAAAAEKKKKNSWPVAASTAFRLSNLALHHLVRASPRSMVDDILLAAAADDLVAENSPSLLFSSEQPKKQKKDDTNRDDFSLLRIKHSHNHAVDAGVELFTELKNARIFESSSFTSIVPLTVEEVAADPTRLRPLEILDFLSGGGAGAAFATALSRMSPAVLTSSVRLASHVTFLEPSQRVLDEWTKPVVERSFSHLEDPVFRIDADASIQEERGDAFDLIVTHNLLSNATTAAATCSENDFAPSFDNATQRTVARLFYLLRPGGWIGFADLLWSRGGAASTLPTLLDLMVPQTAAQNLLLTAALAKNVSGGGGAGEECGGDDASRVHSVVQVQQQLLRAAGFEEIRIRNCYPKPFTVVVARKPRNA